MQLFDYLPFLALIILVVVLLMFPRVGLAKPAVIAALMALAALPDHIGLIVGKVAPSLLGVLIMMSAVQLAVSMVMDDKGADWLGDVLASPLRSAAFVRLPASVLVPVVLMPLALVLAMMIHNIPAVALLAPIAFTLCQRIGIPWIPCLVGLIPASNLGGASAAWGDTPAIIQRQMWGFDVSTFAVNMLPRNLVMLAMLIVVIAGWSYWLDRRTGSSWRQEHERIRLRDQSLARRVRSAGATSDQFLGAAGLIGLFLALHLPCRW
jgi:Na+/H+ antiporter NhaD/arsenite permease-like protein